MYAINANTLNLRMTSERSETTAFSPSQTVTNESSSPSITITNITTQQVTKLDGEYVHAYNF